MHWPMNRCEMTIYLHMPVQTAQSERYDESPMQAISSVQQLMDQVMYLAACRQIEQGL